MYSAPAMIFEAENNRHRRALECGLVYRLANRLKTAVLRSHLPALAFAPTRSDTPLMFCKLIGPCVTICKRHKMCEAAEASNKPDRPLVRPISRPRRNGSQRVKSVLKRQHLEIKRLNIFLCAAHLSIHFRINERLRMLTFAERKRCVTLIAA